MLSLHLELTTEVMCFERPLFGLQESAPNPPEVTGASAAKFVLDAEIVD